MLKEFKIYHYTKPDGTEYSGGMNNEVPSGFGIFKNKYGKEYRCEWKNGTIDGIANIIYVDGREFLGRYNGGQKQGVGKVTFGNKVYRGEFSQNQRTGVGELFEFESSDLLSSARDFNYYNSQNEMNSKYIKKGYYKNGRLNGFGINQVPMKNYSYIGMYVDGSSDGDGIEITNEGKYNGKFKRGLRHGPGEFQGEVSYRGYWAKGLKDQFGIEKTSIGDEYEGSFEKGKKNGVGKFQNLDGTCYVGYFKKSMRSSFGKLEQNGSIYVGGFQENKKSGLGYFKESNNCSYFGEWREDCKYGLGYEVTTQDEFRGEFYQGKRHGKGVLKTKGEDKLYVFYNNGVLQGRCSEDLSYLKKKFSKEDINSFFISCKSKLDGILETLDEQRSQFEIDISYVQIEFKKEQKDLKQKLMKNRRELIQLENTYKSLIENFERNMMNQMGRTCIDSTERDKGDSSFRSNDKWQPMSFTPGKYEDQDYSKITQLHLRPNMSKDGETGRLMNSDYYTNMLKTNFNLKSSTSHLFYKHSNRSSNPQNVIHNSLTEGQIQSKVSFKENVNKKLNFSQNKGIIEPELEDYVKSKMEVEMKARALESARRRYVELERRLEKNPNLDFEQISSKGSFLNKSFNSSFNKSFELNSQVIAKEKIKTPHKAPQPDSNRKSILQGAPRSVFLENEGYKEIIFFDDVMIIGGGLGVLSFKENYGSFKLLAQNDDISIINLKLFEERRIVVCLEAMSNNLIILNLDLEIIDKIEVNKEIDFKQTKSSLFVKDNLCIWNSNNDVYILDLYTRRMKKMASFFEVKDCVSETLSFLANPRKQIILGYSKSLKTENIYALYAEDTTKIFKTTKILHISDRFSICRDFRCMSECGDRLFLVGGSASIDKESRRPFIILTNLDESMVPISGKVLDEPGSETINCIKTLEDETGYTVCAGSKGFIFIFKVKNSNLTLQQKYKLDSQDFLADSIDYYASNLYLISNEYSEIKIIQMNNYRPTRPHSLTFSKWNVDNVFKQVQKLNDQKLKNLHKRMTPHEISTNDLEKYQEIVDFNLGNDKRSGHLNEIIKNYNFKLMNKFFSKLSDYEIDNIICYEDLLNYNIQTIKILRGEKKLIILDDLIISSKLDFIFSEYKEKSNNLFILEEGGDLLIFSLKHDKFSRAFDFTQQIPDFNLQCITSSTNCLRILGGFNHITENKCHFVVYERNSEFKVHEFNHIIQVCYDCEVDFNQEYVFIIGRNENFAVLNAYEFNKGMIFTCDFLRNNEEFLSINRLPGTNLLVINTVNSILFLRFFEESFNLEREVKFKEDKLIERLEIIKGDIWIKFLGRNELTKFGLTTKDQTNNKDILIQNERVSKLELDGEFYGNSIKGNFTKNELLRLFSTYTLEREELNIHEKIKIDIENVDFGRRDDDSDNKATAKGSYGSNLQNQNGSKLEKTMPKFGYDDSKKGDSEAEEENFESKKVLEELEKMDKREESERNIEPKALMTEGSLDKENDFEYDNDRDFSDNDLDNTFEANLNPNNSERFDEDEDKEKYATFNKSESDYNSKPHVPLIPDFINVSQHSSIKAKESGSQIETTKKIADQLHSAASHLPTNKPYQKSPEKTVGTDWFKNFKIKDLVNVEAEDIVKIRISSSGNYLYLLTSIDGLLIAEITSSRLSPSTLTDEEIYNFFCLENDICIAFAVQRSSVLVFKGKKIVNVVHSDDESLKNPFLTGISCYEPKFCFKNLNLKVDDIEFDKRIIEESNEESNENDESKKSDEEGEKEKLEKPRFLWLEGRNGAKYLEYDPKEMDCTTGELLSLWKNERDFNDFIILSVEEIPNKNFILGLAFQESAENTFLQVYDLEKKQSQSVYFKGRDIFENKVLMSMISMNNDECLIFSGNIKRNSDDIGSDSLIMVTTLFKDDSAKMNIKQENMAVFTEYSKFWNLKKINETDFIACAEWDLLILKYEGGTIYTCQIVADISEGIIFDACVFSNRIYAVCDDVNSLCKMIEFDEEIPVSPPGK